ncbi:MAG: hypothetical protein AB7S77_21895 [Desulfatirhabdiaceae bacterium]
MIESAAYDLLMELARKEVRDEVRDEVMKEGIEVGEKKGIEEGIQRSIRKMLMRGFKPDEVAAILEVDREKVQRIVDSLAQPVT